MSDTYLKGIDTTVDITQGSPEQYPYVSEDTIAMSNYDYTLGSNVSITGIGIPWTASGTSDTYTLNPNWGNGWSNGTSAKICLDGPEADIEINGESMIGMLRKIEERLNILTPNTKLESEWEELRALGEQYRTLEKHILEKQATWDRLKAMPPPEID